LCEIRSARHDHPDILLLALQSRNGACPIDVALHKVPIIAAIGT
jgi:hypothetical protein